MSNKIECKAIDDVIARMQTVLTALQEQDSEYYTRHPMRISAEADAETIRKVSEKWPLTEQYLYFLQHYVPQSVSWTTDEYVNLDLYSADYLEEGQLGYSYNPVTDEVIQEWPSSYLVIASDEGDPYCIDLSRGDTAVYTAEHGTGSWNFSLAYDNLIQFLHSVLIPRSQSEDWENEDNEDNAEYNYYQIAITGEGRNKVKTLLFIKKAFSCDYAQARAYLAQLPLQVFKGIEARADIVEKELKAIEADYDKRQISWEAFIFKDTR